jgi:hypothetical protein
MPDLRLCLPAGRRYLLEGSSCQTRKEAQGHLGNFKQAPSTGQPQHLHVKKSIQVFKIKQKVHTIQQSESLACVISRTFQSFLARKHVGGHVHRRREIQRPVSVQYSSCSHPEALPTPGYNCLRGHLKVQLHSEPPLVSRTSE